MPSVVLYKIILTCSLQLRIECKKVTNIEKELIDWAFQLTKANMQTL